MSVGTFYYGGSDTPIHIDDRTLAHLKVVISTKLRRSESFTVTWLHPADQPRGRSTIWLHPAIPMRFVFDDPGPSELDRAWIADLVASGNSSGGITLTAEDFETGDVFLEQVASGPAVGKIEVQELSIDKLTVAGVELPAGDIAQSAGSPLSAEDPKSLQ